MRRRSESTMDAAVMMETCPDSETLAAFSDGALDTKVRLEVLRHVADCGQCQHELVELDAAKRELQLEPANVTRGPWRPWLAPLVAAAAVVVVLFGMPSIRERILGGDPMGKLVEAANQEKTRPNAARLSGAFEHRDHSPKRGGEEKPSDPYLTEAQVQLAAWNVIERAEKKPTAANLHASGVGHLFLEKRENRVAAVRELEKAATANAQSAAILNDLAAAYIARADKGDYARAYAAATKAWNIEPLPAAAWNMALALEYAGNDTAAIAAWQRYLTIDPSSPWADEVKTKILPRLRPLE